MGAIRRAAAASRQLEREKGFTKSFSQPRMMIAWMS
jgi:hypothetical protein